MLDIVTFGESMLRLTPPSPLMLEQSASFEVRAAGAESNVAITAARIGMCSGWISRLPKNPLGRRVARAVQAHGVDLSRLVWADDGRVGIYFIDSSKGPRPREIFYDRAGSAITEMTLDDVDWDYLASARVLHLSGITLALGEKPRSIVHEALEQAARSEQLVSFDLNYRAKLWAPEEARAEIIPLLGKVDILSAGLSETHSVLGERGGAQEVAEALCAQHGFKVAVVTDGYGDAVAFDGTIHTRTPKSVVVVDPIGAGDAFMAGFLVGYLERGTEYGLAMATALGALKLTYPGDIAWCTREELIDFMEDRSPPPR